MADAGNTGTAGEKDSITIHNHFQGATIGNLANQAQDGASQNYNVEKPCSTDPESEPQLPAEPTQPGKTRKSATFIIEGSIKDLTPMELARLQAFVESLKKRTGDASLTVTEFCEGSIRLTLEGSEEGMAKLQELVEAGELSEILNRHVRAVDFAETCTHPQSKASDDQLKASLVASVKADGAHLIAISLVRADLVGADLRGADLRGANLFGANLVRSDLRGADLFGANLVGADLRGAAIDEVTQLSDKWRLVHRIVNAGASGEKLSGVNLSRANLSFANLSKADLSEADLSRANLSRSNLSEADLKGTNLFGTSLLGANLRRVNLREANLIGAEVSEADCKGANFNEADCKGASFSQACFRGADLRGGDFRGANFSQADFKRAKVKSARFFSSSGLTELAKADLKFRGAIFDDSPGDRSSISTPVPR